MAVFDLTENQEAFVQSGGCNQCGECCKYILVDANYVNWDLRWMEGRHGELRGRIMFLPCRCQYLRPDNKCDIHESKPEYCKRWPRRDEIGLRELGCTFWDVRIPKMGVEECLKLQEGVKP